MPRFPGLDARAVFWIPAIEDGAPAGGWLVLDADGDGVLGAADLVARIGSASLPVTLDVLDFVSGTFFANEGGPAARAGTAGKIPWSAAASAKCSSGAPAPTESRAARAAPTR